MRFVIAVLIVVVKLTLIDVYTASAQLVAASDGPIVYGHHHLNVTSVEEHKKFWVDALGGTPTMFGQSEIFKFRNVLVFVREQAPEGGMVGTTVNHIGFTVDGLEAFCKKLEAKGITFDMPYREINQRGMAIVMAPDNVKVELVENQGQSEPITLHHIHFAASDVDAMKAWYVETFDAVPGMRGSFQAADLPGVNLTYSPGESLTGTQGRSLDHIGFEVDGLEAFCKKLEAQGVTFDVPYREIDQLGIAIAFFTDPFGTYIELTEGLDKF